MIIIFEDEKIYKLSRMAIAKISYLGLMESPSPDQLLVD